MPLCTVTQPLSGKSAQEIFSTDLFIQEIKNLADNLKIDISSLEEKALPLLLESCLQSKDSEVCNAAQNILKTFGERLAVIFLCLKEGSLVNQNAHPSWEKEHWDYWNSLKQIILVGGLASPPLGELLIYYMEEVFVSSNKWPYDVILGKDSAYAALRGCSTLLSKDEYTAPSYINLIFDYGQSFIKRSYAVIQNQELKDIVILDKTLSQHVEWDIADSDLERQEAILLNKHFLDTIAKTIDEIEAEGLVIHPHIIMSIANYVKDGVIANRGGYGKLRLIAPNYADYLSSYLKQIYHRNFYFTLVHDGTAMAAGYTGHTKSVCISLGTAFGVGFPKDEDS